MFLQHLSDSLGLLDTLGGVWTGSYWLLQEDMSVREEFIKLDFDVILGL